MFLGYPFHLLLQKKHKRIWRADFAHFSGIIKLHKNMGLLGKSVEICWFWGTQIATMKRKRRQIEFSPRKNARLRRERIYRSHAVVTGGKAARDSSRIGWIGWAKKIPRSSNKQNCKSIQKSSLDLFFVACTWLLHMRTVLGWSGNPYGRIADD